MPTYEYRCQFCHELTEAFQRMSDKPLVTCPHCGKEGLTRIVSGGAGVLYKGEGWYVTDYSKKSSGGKESSIPAAATSKSTSKEPASESKASQPSEGKNEKSSETKKQDTPAPASTPAPSKAKGSN